MEYARVKPALWGMFYTPEIRLFALFHLIEIEWLEDDVEDKENKFRIHKLLQTPEGYFLKNLFEKHKKNCWNQ